MKKIKLLTRIGCFIGACLILSGCWDRVEINDIGIVLADAIDLEPNGQFRGTLQVALPGQMGGATGGGGGTSGSKTFYIDSHTGWTLEECVRGLQAKMSRRLFFSHRRVMIISETLARKVGIRAIFDIASRMPENRLTAYMVIAKGSAAELLKAQPQMESYSGEAIRELVRSRQIMDINMKEAANSLGLYGKSAILPYLGVAEIEKGEQPSKEIEILGYAQIQNGKMVGIIKRKNASALQWLANEFEPYFMTITEKNNSRLSLHVQKGEIKITPTLNGSIPHFTVEARGSAEVWENLSNLDLLEHRNIEHIERLMAAKIKRNMVENIRKMQDRASDSAGFGMILARAHPHIWTEDYRRHWGQTLKKATFTVQVQAQLARLGLTSSNATTKE